MLILILIVIPILILIVIVIQTHKCTMVASYQEPLETPESPYKKLTQIPTFSPHCKTNEALL